MVVNILSSDLFFPLGRKNNEQSDKIIYKEDLNFLHFSSPLQPCTYVLKENDLHCFLF